MLTPLHARGHAKGTNFTQSTKTKASPAVDQAAASELFPSSVQRLIPAVQPALSSATVGNAHNGHAMIAISACSSRPAEHDVRISLGISPAWRPSPRCGMRRLPCT